MPFLRVLVLAFALAHATGVLDALAVPCVEECDDRGACDEACTPMCATCQCGRCPTAVTADPTAEPPPFGPPPILVALVDLDQALASPDPREILRVPIAPAG